MNKIAYLKPWLSIEEQLRKLEGRGLVVSDRAAAGRFLKYINYYRFAGYALKFQYWDEKKKDRVFKDGVSFDDVRDLCVFDRDLRDCIAEALEVVEISMRSCVAFHFARRYGPFGHTNDKSFDADFSRPRPSRESRTKIIVPYKDWRATVIAETRRSSEVFVKHFEKCYSQYPDLPIWVVSEICSFGTLSKMYANLHNSDQGAIASEYELQYLVLRSWLHSLTYVRNICAHHARLWDKVLQISPEVPRRKNWQKVIGFEKTLYVVVLMLNWLMAHDSVDKDAHRHWKTSMERLMDDFVVRFPALFAYTGFPVNWKKNPLWWQY